MSDIYASIASDAGSGSNSLGEISTALLNLGLTVEAARNALNTVAINVGSDPQQLAAINAELNFLNTYGAGATTVFASSSAGKWILPIIVIGGLVWYFSRKSPR